MARVRRYGYIVEWFLSDHNPRHIHVYDAKGRFFGRLNIDRMLGLEDWTPDKKLVKLVQELRREGRL